MGQLNTVVRASRVVTPRGERPAAIGIDGGSIVVMDTIDADLTSRTEIRADDDVVVLPGLVDTHVHLQDPGHSDWEGFDSGTRAAAAGGITTLIDMPLDSLPVTVDPEALKLKRATATGRCHVDVGFWAGVTPWNGSQLRELHEAGAFGFKCFLANTGLAEFPPVSTEVLKFALTELKAFNALLLVHAEDSATLENATSCRGHTYREFLDARPPLVETRAVEQVIEATRATGGRSHVVHISSAEAAQLIANAQRDGVAISAETCPHYLALTAADVPDGATEFKVCPPIREADNAERLWAFLAEGVLNMVVSDHSPCTAKYKALEDGDFDAAFGGVSSLQISLPVMWTEARRRGMTLVDVANLMARSPAAFAGLHRKGVIAAGFDADLCFLAPDESFVVAPSALAHRQPFTPYSGRQLYGVIRETWLRGEPVRGDDPKGRLMTRINAGRMSSAG